MTLDVELYRRTIYAEARDQAGATRRISVIDIGSEATERTLVFLHGFGGSATQWVYQLQTFGSVHDLRVIAPDLRGHGLSDNPPGSKFTLSEMVDDLELILATLAVTSPFYLIAHSFGGAIATEYALRHPESLHGLVLLGVPSRFLLRQLLSLALQVPDPVFGWLAKRLKVALFAPQHTLKYMNDHLMSTWQGAKRLPLV
ncbi:MAG TPA: alpha/beta fold hydrolase, partial [Ktedonobacteraceae bacterium]|nr:alpha/beta fold hydrolase [Ktedonobacteraceae bacterium]